MRVNGRLTGTFGDIGVFSFAEGKNMPCLAGGAIDGAARSASVMASENTVCLATDTRQIQRLTGDDRLAFGYILYRVFAETLAERLRLTTQELMRERKRFHLKNWLPGGR